VARRWILLAVGLALVIVAGLLLRAGQAAVGSEWAYDMTGLRAAQGRGLDGSGITVAVVDTGIDPNHPSLKNIRITAWRDFVNGRPQPYDDAGHGSHVTGILAGKGANFLGRLQGFNLHGAAPGISLVAVKSISGEGSGTASNVAAGINYAVQQGADVICLSLGSRPGAVPLLGDEITNAVNNAINRGILVVASAGNTGEDTSRRDVESPANILRVIAVGAVNRDRQVAGFSARGDPDQNYGPSGPAGRLPHLATRDDPHKKPELVAPGVGILSAWRDGAYVRADGTSQAAPFVCGSLALLLQANPQLRTDDSSRMVDQVKTALMQSVDPVPGQQRPHDSRAGYGLLRADRLLDRF
jgi:serine protease AprX